MTVIDPATLAALRKAGISPAAYEKFAAAERAQVRAEHEAQRGKTAARSALVEGLALWGVLDPNALAAEFRAAGVTDPSAVGDICMAAAGGSRRLSTGAVEMVRLELFAASRRSGRRAAA